MSNKKEGTFHLDGLIEGKASLDPERQQQIEHWALQARKNGIPLKVSLENNLLNIIPESDNFYPTPATEDPLPEHICKALNIFAEHLTPPERESLFSTLRSRSYDRNLETQALYGVLPGGAFEVQSRRVPTQTIAPPEPAKPADYVKSILLTVCVTAAFIFILSLFIDIRTPFTKLWNNTFATEIQISQINNTFQKFLHVEVDEKNSSSHRITLLLKRSEVFPVELPAIEREWQAAEDDMMARLVAESFVRGEFRVEIISAEKELLQRKTIPLSAIPEDNTLQLEIPLKDIDTDSLTIQIRPI